MPDAAWQLQQSWFKQVEQLNGCSAFPMVSVLFN
jgi:hypothetical protein